MSEDARHPRRLRGAATLSLSLCLCLSAAPAKAVDWMGMVEMYGQNVVDTLQTELLQPRIPDRGAGARADPAPLALWPEAVSEAADLERHVFSVGELADMESADRERLRAIVDGRRITVEGLADLPPRADKAFSLLRAPGDAGYRVWASWRGQRPEVRQGERVRLRGLAAMERRSHLSIRDGEILTTTESETPAPSGAREADPDPEALRFAASPEVSEALAERFAETLAPALAAGRSEAELLAVLRGGDLQRAFAEALRPYDFSDRDLADVTTGHLVMLWQVARDQPEEPSRAGVLAVRGQIREALQGSDWPRRMTDPQKQRFAETLVVGTMLIVARYLHGKQGGDGAVVAMAVEDARQMTQGYGGPDLARLRLAEGGFEEE